MKSDIKTSFLYSVLMTVLYLLGHRIDSHSLGTGLICFLILSVSFVYLLLKRLKNIHNDFLKVIWIVVKIYFLAFLMFLVMNLMLSIVINRGAEIDLSAPLAELPRILVGVITYGVWTIICIPIVLIVKLLTGKKSNRVDILDDHVVEK